MRSINTVPNFSFLWKAALMSLTRFVTWSVVERPFRKPAWVWGSFSSTVSVILVRRTQVLHVCSTINVCVNNVQTVRLYVYVCSTCMLTGSTSYVFDLKNCAVSDYTNNGGCFCGSLSPFRWKCVWNSLHCTMYMYMYMYTYIHVHYAALINVLSLMWQN